MEDNREWAWPDFYQASKREEGSILFSDEGGFIFTLQQWETFKRKVDKFYTVYTPESIENHNAALLEKYQPRYRGRKTDWKPCPPIIIPDHVKQLKKICKLPGWIYWLTSPAKQGIKIGKTAKWIKWRFRGIARQLDDTINCIGAFNTPYYDSVELLVHEYFHQNRITKPRGEWFDLSPEQIESIPDVIRLVHAERGLL